MKWRLCVLLCLLCVSCNKDSYQVKLSGPLVVGNDWVELHPEQPLKAEKTFQFVILDLEPPLKCDILGEGNGPDRGKGILMPDGGVINPEIEVIDQDGNAFSLVWRGARGGLSSPAYRLPYPNELPRDREYKAVRIRSPKPIKCKAIYWFCDSSKDWK
jgi:hypothetical protein